MDSYVYLDDARTPGLGAHWYERLDARYAVVGVAKTAYRRSTFAARLTRGTSNLPLFVTASGMDQNQAAQLVARRHGPFRIPAPIACVDQLMRQSSR